MIRKLSLTNWLCYRGEHALELEAKPYAVHARTVDNPSVSNWQGKSALVEAVRFALFGKHRKPTEDGWITDGEKSGGVRVDFEDGHWIARTRTRGKPTELLFGIGEKTTHAKDAAQDAIQHFLGLTPDDYSNTCDWSQGNMARIVNLAPGARTSIVSDWLGLGKLEDALSLAKSDYAAQLRAFQEVDQACAAHDMNAPERRPSAEVKPVKEGYIEAQAREVEVLEERLEAAKRSEIVRGRYDQQERMRQELAEIKAKLKGADPFSREKETQRLESLVREASAEDSAAAQDRRQKAALASGRFDGRCPVAGIECPARADINARKKQNEALAQAAVDRHEKASLRLVELVSESNKHKGAISEELRLEARRDAIEVQLASEGRFEDLEGEDPTVVAKFLQEAREELHRARERRALVEHMKSEGERWAKRRDELKAKREEVHKDLRVCKEAVAIFREALRLVAEGNLAGIERKANSALVAAAIDLQVDVRWAREGNDPARECAECGEAFPASRKVKACQRCGAERGPHLVQSLEILPTHDSGAGRDLAGIFVQFAASAWVRHARGSTWGTACLDEPVAQLDKENRRAFAAMLPILLRECAFRQALVIAHSHETLEALPGRIEIVNNKGDAKVRVVK